MLPFGQINNLVLLGEGGEKEEKEKEKSLGVPSHPICWQETKTTQLEQAERGGGSTKFFQTW